MSNANDGDIAIYVNDSNALAANTRYTVVYKLRGPNRSSVVTAPGTFASAGTFTTPMNSTGGNQLLTANQVVTRWATFTADATALGSGRRVIQSLQGKTAGDYLEVADVMIYPGDYDSSIVWAWGNSPGWVWNGTPNNSTSTGPPL